MSYDAYKTRSDRDGFEENPGPDDLTSWRAVTAEDAPTAVRGVPCETCGTVPIATILRFEAPPAPKGALR